MEINICQLNKQEMIHLLTSSYHAHEYQELLNKTKQYIRINHPHESDDVITFTAYELLYENCRKAFQYSEYVYSTKDALDKLRKPDSSLMKVVNDAIQKEEKKKNAIDAENKRIEALKKKCKEQGLDFETENKKYLKKQRMLNVSNKLCLIAWLLCVVINLFSFPSMLFITILAWTFFVGMIVTFFMSC